MTLRFDGPGYFEKYGETIRLVSDFPEAVIIGEFNSRYEAGTALHLQPQGETDTSFYLKLFDETLRRTRESIIETLIAEHMDGLGYVALNGCQVYIETGPYDKPLVSPTRFLDVELPRTFMRCAVSQRSGLNQFFAINRGSPHS